MPLFSGFPTFAQKSLGGGTACFLLLFWHKLITIWGFASALRNQKHIFWCHTVRNGTDLRRSPPQTPKRHNMTKTFKFDEETPSSVVQLDVKSLLCVFAAGSPRLWTTQVHSVNQTATDLHFNLICFFGRCKLSKQMHFRILVCCIAVQLE